MKALQLQAPGSLNLPAMLRAAKSQAVKHLFPVAFFAATVCLFSGIGYAINPNASDMWTMYVSGAAALAAAALSDRKGGAL